MWAKRKRIARGAAAAVLVLVPVLAVFVYVQWRSSYPYGFSHCCDLQLHSALCEYAQAHNGDFPAGEATPEASLSLLYRYTPTEQRPAIADILRGKTVPERVVAEILDRGELLSPETCGWHYVEGLRVDDDYRLALFWDKAGLTHNGGQLAGDGHIVMCVGGWSEHIPDAEWGAFVENQRKLLAERANAIHRDATIRIGDREMRVQIRVIDGTVYGVAWGGDMCRIALAAVQGPATANRALPMICLEEIEGAKVVVEPAALNVSQQGEYEIAVCPVSPRVRFVMRSCEIVYDQSGFRIVNSAGTQ